MEAKIALRKAKSAVGHATSLGRRRARRMLLSQERAASEPRKVKSCKRGTEATFRSRQLRTACRLAEKIRCLPKSFPAGKLAISALNVDRPGKGKVERTEKARRSHVAATVKTGGDVPGKKSANKQRVARLLRLPAQERVKALKRLAGGIAARWDREGQPKRGVNPELVARKFVGGWLCAFDPAPSYVGDRRPKVLQRTYWRPVDAIPRNLRTPLRAFRRLFHAEWKRQGRPPEVRGGLLWEPKSSVRS